jgi:DNA (cytosine-5)-methyltransferase 1
VERSNARRRSGRPTVLSLFTGAGGLDLGLEAAGFETRLCVEIDEDARRTLSSNRPRWTIATPGDIHQHRPPELLKLARLQVGELDLLAGGPPCQPFSKAGYWAHGDSQRLMDPRASTLWAYLETVDEALPKVLLLENVKGLTYNGKDDGLRLLKDGLTRINKRQGTAYSFSILHLNAAHFGVPQYRERVFLIANRDGTSFCPPKETHGEGAGLEPWLTAWDAIGDLATDIESPACSGKWARLLPSIPEGENYLFHTPKGEGEPLFGWRTRYWSFLLKLAKDRPSWTLQAEPGPATGPFHWKSRPLTTREMCRIQTFPDDYEIEGDRRAVQRQLGNAVPCALAEVIGREIASQLLGRETSSASPTLLPQRRPDMPPRERTRKVPADYMQLCGQHEPHPGKGLGPGARGRKKAMPTQSERWA